MPELPEVEVLRRGLERALVGSSILTAEIRNPSLRERVDLRSVRSRSIGRKIVSVGRRAKYLILGLEGGSSLVIHLGMSGRVTLAEVEKPVEKHEHASFLLSSGLTLRFRDPRRFGLILALASDRVASDRHFCRLGIEPLGPDMTAAALREKSRGRRAPIKSFLMDSRIVVGLGNIYATEVLFRAGIHPRRSAGRISYRRWLLLAEAIRAVLEQAIAEGGTTLNDFRGADGSPGYFQVSLAVYGREGEACPDCAGAIRRIVQSGRSTFYCPRCQH